MVTKELVEGFQQLGTQIRQQKTPQVRQQPIYQQPAYQQPPQYTSPVQPYLPPEDPEVAKWRNRWMKILMYLVGGTAVLLIAWRIILKFL